MQIKIDEMMERLQKNEKRKFDLEQQKSRAAGRLEQMYIGYFK